MKRGSIKVWGVLLLMLAVIMGGGVVGVRRWKEQRAFKRKWSAITMPETLARVPRAWTAQTLAERLKRSGKVRDAATFVEAAQQVGLKEVQPGSYVLPERAGPLELARLFKNPPPLVKVTFPEGWTAAQMADRLAERQFSGAQEFKRLAYPVATPVSPWEGRLFPNTYDLPRRGTATQLLQHLNDRFRKELAALPTTRPSLDAPAKGAKTGPKPKPMSQNELVTLASLVERETDTPSERPIIAGVLLNRLHRGMRLQCDASVQYVRMRALAAGRLETGHKERLLWRDLKVDSPYNTYEHGGLPPGPICNPGRAALRAAASPKSSDYLFYVMSPKLGRHRFARTFQEHLRNIRLAKTERQAAPKPPSAAP